MILRHLRSAAVGLLAPVIWCGAASAQITPNPTTFTVSGPVDFSQVGGGTINCNLTMSIVVNPGGMTGVVTSASLTPGNPLCAALATTTLPWTVNRIPPGTMGRFEVSNIRIVGVASWCDNGRIIVIWDNWGTGYVETNGTMPGAAPPIPYPNATCTIEGTVYQTSGAPVAVS
jgi:hypothetical protein